MPSPKIIITTEKDAVRLEHMDGLGDDVRSQMYVLPLEIKLQHKKVYGKIQPFYLFVMILLIVFMMV